MKVRVCEDIVVLLQHKNLIAEYNGRRFIKVGVIEKELGIMMRIPKFDPGQIRDYQSRKLENDINQGGDLLEMLTRDTDNDLKISDEMREFLTKQFDNPSWERLLQARWLKKKQQNQDNEFDPEYEKIVPIIV